MNIFPLDTSYCTTYRTYFYVSSNAELNRSHPFWNKKILFLYPIIFKIFVIFNNLYVFLAILQNTLFFKIHFKSIKLYKCLFQVVERTEKVRNYFSWSILNSEISSKSWIIMHQQRKTCRGLVLIPFLDIFLFISLWLFNQNILCTERYSVEW